jgi:hypothetical protein
MQPNFLVQKVIYHELLSTCSIKFDTLATKSRWTMTNTPLYITWCWTSDPTSALWASGQRRVRVPGRVEAESPSRADSASEFLVFPFRLSRSVYILLSFIYTHNIHMRLFLFFLFEKKANRDNMWRVLLRLSDAVDIVSSSTQLIKLNFNDLIPMPAMHDF